MGGCLGGQKDSEHKDGPFQPAGNQANVAGGRHRQSSLTHKPKYTKGGCRCGLPRRNTERGILQDCMDGEGVQESHSLAEAETGKGLKAKSTSFCTELSAKERLRKM